MRREERAAQIWPLLTYVASLRATLTYMRLGELIGAPPVALGGWMEPIQSYCILRELPPLTVLVVSDASGVPGEGFTGAKNVSEAQACVFQHDWREVHVPTPAEFAAAVMEYPSNGARTASRTAVGVRTLTKDEIFALTRAERMQLIQMLSESIDSGV